MLEEGLTSGEVGAAQGLRLQQVDILRLVLREVGLRGVHGADHAGDELIYLGALHRLELSDGDRREDGALQGAGGDGLKGEHGGRGVRDERRQGVGAFFGGEGLEGGEQGRDGGVVAQGGEGLDDESTERPRDGGIDETGLQDRSRRTVTRLYEHGQRALAGRGGCVGVGQLGAEIGAAGLVAREGIEFVDQGEQLRRSLRAQGLGLRGPVGRSLERPTLPHAGDEAFHQALAQSRVGLLGRDAEEALASGGVDGETTIDEFGDLRHLRRLHQGHALRGVGADERLDAVPQQQREVMVRRIIGAGQQGRRDGGTGLQRKPGQGGSELATDDGGLLVRGQFGQAGSDVAGALRH